MAEHGHGEHGHEAHGGHGHAAAPVLDFEKTELAQFDKDDTQAGSAIGRMLAIIFLYTIFAMSIAGWWTFRSIMAPSPSAPAKTSAH